MQFDDFGTLIVRTTSAGGSLPTAGSIVKITGVGDNNRDIVYSVLTDRDGVTEKIKLPAPLQIYSLYPSSAEAPYAVYDVQVSAPGFYTKTIHNVTVFPNVTTELPVNMIPDTLHNSGKDYPPSGLDTTIPENTL